MSMDFLRRIFRVNGDSPLELVRTRLATVDVKAAEIGCFGVQLASPESLEAEQRGYQGATWKRTWIVIGRELGGGDPFFLDTAGADWPVYTAKHGTGAWFPRPVASSFANFQKGLEITARVCEGRENPVALEKKPLTKPEVQQFKKDLKAAVGSKDTEFWHDLVAFYLE